MKAIQTICWVALLAATLNLLQQQGLLEIIAREVGLRDELVEQLENDASDGTEENNSTTSEAEQPSGENSEGNRRNVRKFLRN